MDIPRYALIAASILLGLMLLGEWTRFNTAQQEESLPTVPMVDAGRAAPDTADEMTVFNNTSQNDMDLPSVDDINLTNSQALFGDSPADAPALLIVKVLVLPRVYAAVAIALGCTAPPALFQLLGVLPASPSVHALAMARGVAPGTFASLVPTSLLCTAAALLGPDELYTAAGTAAVLWLAWKVR